MPYCTPPAYAHTMQMHPNHSQRIPLLHPPFIHFLERAEMHTMAQHDRVYEMEGERLPGEDGQGWNG